MSSSIKATRDALATFLDKAVNLYPELVVLSADLKKPTKVDLFAAQYPDRYIECGIAENNMIGIAAGLAQSGMRPICTSFASFLTGKYDTIRVSVAYQNVPVLMVGTHSGMAIGKDGVTQMGLEDVSLMRSLPNIRVLSPSTYNQALSILGSLFNSDSASKQPTYLRLGRQPCEEYYQPDSTLGSGFHVHGDPSDLAIISSGCVLGEALSAQKVLAEQGILSTVIDLFDLTHYDEPTLSSTLRQYSRAITIEDHSVIGGTGSIIESLLVKLQISIPLVKLGVQHLFPESGSPSDLYNKYDVCSAAIVNACTKANNF